ncbi:hypothetical protein PGT21_003795 [Puccinia graminis f. sp. tritici]|uniref:Uncharacterized protein n=2 Tax=Puccinia graminis f. sp. tritici TaxID=56615 RepID=H6QSF2_PUCGT|nr:uncharacterized protein PGTG_21770 [Puccinia graminis f. sp. tritici CRL 75-36-700-3]EHS63684.1 hypothetical protein PGTG_21770 [Puccinia graminis f. sp. tritici CRL 75-36-700-3]KAA1064461.1 hypothetical protein PGT21_003795 [Puccinia graminis f. sp. tritici]
MAFELSLAKDHPYNGLLAQLARLVHIHLDAASEVLISNIRASSCLLSRKCRAENQQIYGTGLLSQSSIKIQWSPYKTTGYCHSRVPHHRTSQQVQGSPITTSPSYS